MKKLLKNKKALSPVVAAIILIAVTVAVSIAVAAWMGSMTFTFMETEELRITTATLNPTSDVVSLVVVNSGSTDISITAAKISGGGETETFAAGAITGTPVAAGATVTVSFTTTPATGVDVVGGTLYSMELITGQGNTFTYQATA